jgi:hypothetical protein
MDDDDWVGTPPEGHHTRDQAKPEFWRALGWQLGIPGAVVLAAIIVIVVVLATR